MLGHAAPGISAPVAVRAGGDEPRMVKVLTGGSESGGRERSDALVAAVVSAIDVECCEIGEGNMAVIVPESMYACVRDGLTNLGVDFAGPGPNGLGRQITLVPVRLVKGLEVDATIVVEPGRIVAEERCGVRALYVCLTRATKRVVVVHAEPLPAYFSADPTVDAVE